MQKTVRHIVTTLALSGVVAAPATAQVVDVRVKVDTQAIREMADGLRDALRDALGPDVRSELRRELSTVTRDVAEALEHLSHAPWFSSDTWTGSARQRNFPAQQTDRETRTFAIGATGEFELENLSGSIRIQPGSGRDLTIGITRLARGRTDADAREGLARVRVETTHRGTRATARTVYPSGRQPDYSVSVDYVVTAPAGTRITAKNVSGDIIVGAMLGELTVTTMSGDIEVAGATHLLSAKAVSGDVVLRDSGSAGTLDASTMSGDITATNIKAGRLDLSSISGSVTARNARAQSAKLNSMSSDLVFDGELAAGGRYEFTAHSGNVRIALDGRTGFTLEARTFAGSTRSDFPLQVSGIGDSRRGATRSLRGTFGDGSATVTATSFSGSVSVVKR